MSKVRYSKHITWYEQLQEKERARLDIVCAHILNRTIKALEDLNGETLMRKSFAHEEELPEFYKKEQRRTLEIALSRPLQNQTELSTLINSILFEIRTGELSVADLYYLPGETGEGDLDPWSFKWFESAIEITSYLMYAAQIEHIMNSGILVENRRVEGVSAYSINEILLFLTRQVIKSVGGMDECLKGKIRIHPKGNTLRLEDILVNRITSKEVKELYNIFLGGKTGNAQDLSKFLRHLRDKGYFRRKLTDTDLGTIGRNEFKLSFNIWRTNPYMPPLRGEELWNWPPYNRIPDLR
jgi:hypothetical protein